MNTLTLIAAAPPVQPAKPAASDLLDRAEFWWGTGGLVAALILGAVVVGWVDRWRKRQALAEQAESGEELTSFRAMFDRGEITEAEYARLRQKVAARVKTPAKPAAGAESATAA
ncbi:MAG: SHOCT domain-containing protein, partial [Gemmataceae bacterium]|nr:SHOCT domain-containing protein [Gemmataceae bacterium]